MTKLIVGLGNPGREYEQTRHNIAWLTFDQFSFSSDLFWKEKFKGLFATKSFSDDQFVFLKPQTYMNLSGQSVRAAIDFYKVNAEDILVIHDEIDLPYGTLALKNGGGLAGNNGLKSMAQELGTRDFMRLRMGIGRPQHGDVSNHVLSPFNNEEQINLEDFLKLGADAIDSVIKIGFQKSQNKFSKKSVIQ